MPNDSPSATPSLRVQGHEWPGQSEHALHTIVSALPGAMIAIDEGGTVRACSKRWLYMFLPLDEPEDDVEGRSFFDWYEDPDDYWHALFGRCMEQQRDLHGQAASLVSSDGTTHHVDWNVTPWSLGSGEQGVLLAVTDQSRRHQAEKVIRQVERRFDVLIETISEGVLLMDGQGIFRDCNEEAERIFGRPPTDIIGSSFRDEKWSGLYEDGTPMPNAQFPFWQAMVEREPVREQVMGIYPPDEPPRWIRVNAQPLFEDGEEVPYGVLSSFDDITGEQLKEEALQTSKDLLSSVLASSLDGIMVLQSVRDDEGTIEDFEWLLLNPQAEKLLNQSSGNLVGKHLLRVMPGHREEGLFEAYARVVETGEPFETEIEYTHEGLNVWLQIMSVRIEDGVAVTFRDISERKEAAQAMATANTKLEQRNRALRDFAYIASHDLQEPLRKISAFSNLMVEDYNDEVDEMGKYYLDRMQDAAQRMSQLISDLLVYSRVTTRARPFEPVDLNVIARNVCSDLDMQISDVKGRVAIEKLPTIEADSTQMRQLLQNLIGNALKFHRDGVPPVIRVAATTKRDQEVNGTNHDEIVQITVKDNGIGFEEKYADRIFTPFKRLHGRSEYSGTGMGLAICRRIVERHGGAIRVHSVPDEGTTFTVSLPVKHKEGTPEAGWHERVIPE